MPLPAALAARLAKRGIVPSDKNEQVKQATPAATTTEQVEEVFAEDYDEPDTTHAEYHDQNMHTAMETGVEELLIYEAVACPNKNNKYHCCTDYCRQRWGYKHFEPNSKLENKRLHMLKKYPLPENWEEVGDPDTGRYYYWNTTTDEVSWLPPTHPRTQITLPAERLKELFETPKEHEFGSDDDEGDIMDIDDFEEIERKILMEKSVKDKEKKREKKKKEEPLDPMDPAAYSDIPRGTWSTGLDTKGQAKTGVDATASGPLYQQRPYPSPGAILRMNQQLDD